MNKQHHFEVIVEVDYSGPKPVVGGIFLNSEESATWWEGTVYSDATDWQKADVDPDTWDGDQLALNALGDLLAGKDEDAEARQYDPGTDAEYVDQITDAFIAAAPEPPMDPTGIDCIERYEGGDS